MKVSFAILPDNVLAKCSRCGLSEWPCLEIKDDTGSTINLCVRCMAFGIDAVTHWHVVKLVERYRNISPFFSDFSGTLSATAGIPPAVRKSTRSKKGLKK